MAELIELIKKDSKFQNEITQIIEKYNEESYPTQAEIRQKASIQSKIFEQAINNLGDTIEDLDEEMEKKANKIEFSENKVGLPDRKVIEEMNKLGFFVWNYHLKEKEIGFWTG